MALPSSPSPIAAVIFDFDGVLADTERLHLAAFQKVFSARGWTLSEVDYFERYLGYDDFGLVTAFGQEHHLGLDERRAHALAAEKTHEFAQYLHDGEVVYPGARACVETLARHYRLGIASGALQEEIVAILAAAGLLGYFPTIVAAGDVMACKPSPEPYLTAARRIGVDPAACVAIEDSAPGLLAASTAGMRTIGITTTSPRDVLRADRIIENLLEVSPALIEELAVEVGPER
jgi:HAD superfamily hydrolase (TIGR01509 family)